MNYIQIELGGEKRGLKFNQGAHVEIQLKIGKSKNVVFASYAIIWGGLIGNCFVKSIEPDFTYEQVCDWVDKLDDSIFSEILLSYKSSLPEVKKDDTKKKHLAQKSTKRNALK